MRIFSVILTIIILSGCDLLFNNSESDKSLYTWKKKQKLEDNHIAIVNLGDLVLSQKPSIEMTKESIQKKSMDQAVGGMIKIQQYLDRIKAQYGERVIFVSPGNLINPNETIEPQLEFIKKYSIITNIGPNELNLLDNEEFNNLNIIASNLIALDKKVLNVPTYFEKEVLGKKIAFIGLTHDQTNTDSLKFHFKAFNKTLSRILYKTHRRHRADIIILLVYADLKCGEDIARKKGKSMLEIGFDPQEKFCDRNTVIHKITQLVPPNAVDAIIMAGPGFKLNHYINHIPVIKNPEQKKYIGKLSLSTEKNGKSTIYNPVKLCHLFFKESQDCFHEDPSIDHTKKTNITFLGSSFD